MANGAHVTASLRFDTGRLDYLRPFVNFPADELAELLGRPAAGHGARRSYGVLHGRRRQRLVDLAVHPQHDLSGHACGENEASPSGKLKAREPRLVKGRQLRYRWISLACRDGDSADSSSLDVGQDQRCGAAERVHLSARNVEHRLLRRFILYRYELGSGHELE